MNKQAALDDIAQAIIDDNITPELAKTAKHLVFGEGSPDAKVVFIGEAPGKKEDETGRPFIGAAGRFLDELLESIGLKREDVYITSILKYRPPNNRDPKPDEKTTFWPYLLAQLEVIAPELVVTLGRHSAKCFLPDLQIGKDHGKLYEWSVSGWRPLGDPRDAQLREHRGGRMGRQDPPSTLRILPLYHPAVALYNSSTRQTLIDDFAQIPNLLEPKEHLNQKRKENDASK